MEDWEQHYREDDFPWDLGEPAPPLREVLAGWPSGLWGEGAVLVPGCGRGHDAKLLHQAGHPAIGLDVSPTALAQARALHGDGPGLQWKEGDLFDPRLAEDLEVAAVWEHTCFCAIDPEQRPDYARALARLLAPGAHLIGLFFLDPGVETGPPFGASREEIQGHLAPYFTLKRDEDPTSSTPARQGREWLAAFVRNH